MIPGWTLAWVRASARRPRRAVTTVLVLVALSVATTASLVAGDALARLFRADARATWGVVDVEARSLGGPYLSDGAARFLRARATGDVVAGAPRLMLQGVAETARGREPQALVLGLGAEDTGFAPLRAAGGPGVQATQTVGLPRDGALLNERLATRLGVGVGGVVELVVGFPQWREYSDSGDVTLLHPPRAEPFTLRVLGVVADEGVADLERRPAVLMRREVLQEAGRLSPAMSTVLHLDVRGAGLDTPEDGGAMAPEVDPETSRDRAEAVITRLAPDAQRLGLVLEPVRADALDRAGEEGGLFRSLLLSLAFLVLLAAAAATVELLTALGLDRARELALLRAMGLRDRAAARLVVAEGLLYAVVGAGLGLLAAVPTGTLLARLVADHFAGLEDGRGREQVALEGGASPWSLLLGTALVLVTAALAARSAARRVLAAEPDAVLRGAQPVAAAAPRGDRRPVLVLAAGAFLLGAGTTAGTGGGSLTYLGVTLLLAAAWLRARRRTARLDETDARAAGLALLWSLAGAAVLGDFSAGVQSGFGVLTVAGVVAVTATAWLLAGRLRRLAPALGRLLALLPGRGAARRTAVTVGAAWGHQERDRTAVRTGTVGAALFTAAALSVLGSAQALPVDRQSGGFDVLGTAVVGIDTGALAGDPQVGDVVGLPHSDLPEGAYEVVPDGGGDPLTVPYPVRLAAATSDLARLQSFGLAAAAPGYRTAQDVLMAAVGDEDKAVVDRYALPEGARVGDDVVVRARGQERTVTLVGVLDTYLLNVVLVGSRTFDDLGERSGSTFVLATADASAGTTPQDLERLLDRAGRPQGLDVDTVAQRRADVVAVNRAFTDVFALMLLLALAVVVVSLAAATSRSARQRRAEIGVLRALGARRRTVVTMLLTEPLVAAVLGGVAGLATGLVVLRLLFAVGYSSLAFVLDVPRLLLAVGGTVLLALVTALLAAATATRQRVGEQLADLG